MKKFFLILLLLTASISEAQVIRWIDTTGVRPTERQTSNRFPLPIQGDVNIDIETLKEAYYQTELVTESFMFLDTTSLTADTASRRINSTSNSLADTFDIWWRFSIVSDSTIQISHYPNFPTNKTFTLKAGESYNSEKLDINNFTNLYYRKQSSFSGVTRPRIYITGQ
jgi:hypothetical protein